MKRRKILGSVFIPSVEMAELRHILATQGPMWSEMGAAHRNELMPSFRELIADKDARVGLGAAIGYVAVVIGCYWMGLVIEV